MPRLAESDRRAGPDAGGNQEGFKKVFIGTVQCEVELSKSHPSFEGFRFLLVEAEHEVEWEGAVVAVDTVDAQVGDMVVVALAPLGSRFDIPEDLPIDGAVIGVVGSITTPAEDEEEALTAAPPALERGRPFAAAAKVASGRDEEELAVESAESGPFEGEGRRHRRRGRESQGERPSEEREGTRRRERPRESERGEARPSERGHAARRADERSRPKGERDLDSRRDAPPKTTTWEEEEVTEAPHAAGREDDVLRPARNAEAAREDLEIVWDSGEAGASGGEPGSIKRKRRRR